MKPEYDVAVIGAGVIGVCSAYYLASKGVDVVLLEKDDIAAGCSFGNGGLIVPSHATPLASPGALGDGLRWMLDASSPFFIKPRLDPELARWLLRFAMNCRHHEMRRALPVLRDLLFASGDLYRAIAATGGFDFGYQRNGSLWVCLTEPRFDRERKEVRLFEEFEIPVRVVSRDEALALEPALTGEVIGGVFYPNDGCIDPARFVTGLARKARDLGAEILTHTEVTGFETSTGVVSRLLTTRGVVRPKQVVLAAGSWSPALARMLQLRLPIQPAKGYSVTLENPEPALRLPLLLGEARVVVNPLGPALRVAGTLEMAGMDFSITARRVQAIRQSSNAYVRGLQESGVLDTWRGLRPCTPDGLPIIERSRRLTNVVIAAGHAMLGMSLGPITGRIVAQLIAGEGPDFDLTRLNVNRAGRAFT